MKALYFFLLFLMSTSTIAAPVIIPVYVPVDNSPAMSQGGCSPPVQFSIEHSCILTYATKMSVNTFSCNKDGESYTIQGDCKGNALTYSQYKTLTESETRWVIIITALGMICFLVFFFWYLNRQNNKGERQYY